MSLLALSVVIFVHELGHMLAAKRAGIGVLEFSIGMGPKLTSILFGGTVYSIRVLPFGGFVKLAGMDEDPESQFSEDQTFQKKSFSARALTLLAGSGMNILLGMLIFMVVYS